MPKLAPFSYTQHLVVVCTACGATAVCQILEVGWGEEIPLPMLPAAWTAYEDPRRGGRRLLCPKHRAEVDVVDLL